jgi:hypothetical protein
MPAARIAWLRAQALRALGIDPLNIAALKKATGVDGNLSTLRKAALKSHGIDPYDAEALRKAAGPNGATPPPVKQKPAKPATKPAPGGQPKPRTAKAKAPRAPKVPTAFRQFITSRCKDLKLAAQVLGVKPKPPLQKSILRTAWIELIGKHHPDRGGDVEAAQAVNAAYQLLSKFAN